MLLGIGDFVARNEAESQLEARMRAATRELQDPKISIDSFPFLGRLLVNGSVASIRASAVNVDAGPLVLATVSIELHDVRLDRNRLITEQEVDLRSIDEGVVEADVTEASLGQALGVPVDLTPGRVTVTVRGVRVTAELTVDDNVLVISGGGVPALRVEIPDAPLLPCASSGEVLEGRVRLRCTIDEIPEELVQAASRASRGGAE